jgi:hypothetical protein
MVGKSSKIVKAQSEIKPKFIEHYHLDKRLKEPCQACLLSFHRPVKVHHAHLGCREAGSQDLN